METEMLTIFDDEGIEIGTAPRSEVHKKGYWHQAFHCWFVCSENGIPYIYLQKRSPGKKDYPGLLDITAAGHLLAQETIEDGVREIHEELGIDVSINDLIPLGIIKYCVMKEELDFIDKELAHVYLFQHEGAINEFHLQEEEVSGMVKIEFNSFYEFCFGRRDELDILGFEADSSGQKIELKKTAAREDFVPHEREYYEVIAERIREKLERHFDED
ncbi:NUDIX hydrolase [Peribacillus deserti]|uniref:NUDIX hydrolase n=1 Tax=Peribacillus deserti TaxID=673318 RepID=A0A2N5M3Q4_9BACI|nr:NUDIX domain-containing protein [Peribacillus deserti]PLT28994.1 NUDIX hydrolase [Peribacillus deserti]